MIVGFLIGLMVGTCLGVIVMALLISGSRADDLDAELRRTRHTCGPKCAPLANLHVDEWGGRIR